LFTLLARNRTTLAVLAALGFTRRQRRGVGVVASTELAVLGILIGVPLGLLLGARTWHAIADSMGIGAAVSLPWRAVLLGPLTALVVAAIVAVVGTRGSLRSLPGDELRVE
jgi:ABC-type antimicrobial peptide transport system permease subunit